MTPIYEGLFDGPEKLCKEFSIPRATLDEYEVLYAWYEYEEYAGDSFALLRKDDGLFEVNGSHCSCYGLEGQWDPTRTTKDALLMRKNLQPTLRTLLEGLS